MKFSTRKPRKAHTTFALSSIGRIRFIPTSLRKHRSAKRPTRRKGSKRALIANHRKVRTKRGTSSYEKYKEKDEQRTNINKEGRYNDASNSSPPTTDILSQLVKFDSQKNYSARPSPLTSLSYLTVHLLSLVLRYGGPRFFRRRVSSYSRSGRRILGRLALVYRLDRPRRGG